MGSGKLSFSKLIFWRVKTSSSSFESFFGKKNKEVWLFVMKNSLSYSKVEKQSILFKSKDFALVRNDFALVRNDFAVIRNDFALVRN